MQGGFVCGGPAAACGWALQILYPFYIILLFLPQRVRPNYDVEGSFSGHGAAYYYWYIIMYYTLFSPQLVCPNYYGEGSFSGARLYIYEFFLVNLSQMWAMYNLVRVIYNNDML